MRKYHKCPLINRAGEGDGSLKYRVDSVLSSECVAPDFRRGLMRKLAEDFIASITAADVGLIDGQSGRKK